MAQTIAALVRQVEALAERVRVLEEARSYRCPTGSRSLSWMHGADLRAARVSVGWTASAVGRAMGVTPVVVTRWERGVLRISAEQAVQLQAIFAHAGVDLTVLDAPLLTRDTRRAAPPTTGRWAQ